MSAYCTEADVKAVATDWTPPTTGWGSRVTDAITRASAMMDTNCNQWFDSRAVTVTTQTCTPNQRRLFLPARMISLTSVTENGQPVSGVFAYPTYLEKPLGCPWLPGQQNIVVSATMGFATPPQDIVLCTAWLTAIMLNLVQKQYMAPSGQQSSTPVSSLPKDMQKIIAQQALVGLHQQPFLIVP